MMKLVPSPLHHHENNPFHTMPMHMVIAHDAETQRKRLCIENNFFPAHRKYLSTKVISQHTIINNGFLFFLKSISKPPPPEVVALRKTTL